VPSFPAFRRSVFVNREGTPPSFSRSSTTFGYSSGWIAFGAMPTEDYKRAARLVDDGDSDAAEELLVSAWDQRLELALQPLKFLYEDQSRWAIGHGRLVIMREALENYADERYASAVTLTLSQIDGIVYDMSGKDARSFFASGAKAAHLTDEHTLAGHPNGLVVLARLFNKDRRQTSVEGDLRRHGIIHGRELEFGTKSNAIKTFVALFAVIEWARPIAEAETARLRSEREERYAGSEETDEDGRRLDRRGFERVQRALTTIELYQQARFDRAGYARDVRELEANDELSSIPGIQMMCSVDGRSFRAWALTEGGIVFGDRRRARGANRPALSGDPAAARGRPRASRMEAPAGGRASPGLVVERLIVEVKRSRWRAIRAVTRADRGRRRDGRDDREHKGKMVSETVLQIDEMCGSPCDEHVAFDSAQIVHELLAALAERRGRRDDVDGIGCPGELARRRHHSDAGQLCRRAGDTRRVSRAAANR
jgi:hypothetical protein